MAALSGIPQEAQSELALAHYMATELSARENRLYCIVTLLCTHMRANDDSSPALGVVELLEEQLSEVGQHQRLIDSLASLAGDNVYV